jgi:ABC-type transport system substrate-binding protein
MRKRTLISTLLVALTAAVLLTATLAAPASATTMRTWSRLAKCESGGRWHINTGNGEYGGLQIAGGTWRAFGGKRYAALPSRASKRQQIRVAGRIKRHQGWGAWPTCSRRIGVR